MINHLCHTCAHASSLDTVSKCAKSVKDDEVTRDEEGYCIVGCGEFEEGEGDE